MPLVCKMNENMEFVKTINRYGQFEQMPCELLAVCGIKLKIESLP